MVGADEPEIALIECEQAGNVQPFGQGDDEGVNKIEISVGVLAHQSGGAVIVWRERVFQDQIGVWKTGDKSSSHFNAHVAGQEIGNFCDGRHREVDRPLNELAGALYFLMMRIAPVEQSYGKACIEDVAHYSGNSSFKVKPLRRLISAAQISSARSPVSPGPPEKIPTSERNGIFSSGACASAAWLEYIPAIDNNHFAEGDSSSDCSVVST